MSLLSPKTIAEHQYMPVYLDSLRVDTIINFNLYIKIGGDMILYRSADLPFSERTRLKLLENKVNRLFISGQARQKYQKYIEQNLDKILIDKKVSQEKKAGILYETSKSLMACST